MKLYKHVTLRSVSGSQINLPKDVWSELGWELNDKLKLTFGWSSPCDEAEPVSLWIEKADE